MKKTKLLPAAIISITLGFVGSGFADTTYTTDADFALGILNSINYDAPNSNQLQLSETGSTFPLLWAANAGEDSVSKIDTDNDCEVARYATWHVAPFHGAWSGPAPSRTAVDSEGNVFVANRQFPNNRQMNVLKILSEGGIDRNGNGIIETSSDVNGDCIIDRSNPLEFIPPVDDNGDGILQTSEIRDERVVWINHVGPSNSLGRSLCIGTDGNLWMGDYNNRAYYKIQASDGAELAGPIATGGLTPYGCLVDSDGVLFSASLSSIIGILDTNTETWLATLNAGGTVYGIALGNDKVYMSGSSKYIQYDPNTGGGEPDGNPATGTFSQPADVGNFTRGISVDGDGDIVQGQSPIKKYNDAGVTQWSTINPASDTRGVVPDSNNHIWAVNRGSNNATKFNKDTGNLMVTVPIGDEPYTYSDATGFAATNTTDPSGIWTIINDSGTAGAEWDAIDWNNEPQGNVPAGASISVEARVSNTQVGLGLATYLPVVNGGTGLGLLGQFIQVRATLRPGVDDVSPILSDLSIRGVADNPICDVEPDGDIDRVDLRAISLARGQDAQAGDPRDANGDGIITPSDVKVCIPLCTLRRCAVPTPN
jgi:hypothetical protein